jgi:hypothetical protein
MENQTRFDLNAALENWRTELAVQPGLSPDDRRELETHLRDTFAELKSRGLSEEESFWLARRRVGQPHKLAAEFVKVDPFQIWRERAFWGMLAFFLSSILIRVISVMAFNLQIVRTPLDSGSLQMTQEIAREVVISSPILIPLVIAMLVRSEKMIHRLSKLTQLIENRLRLTIGVFGIIAIAAVFVMVAAIMHNAKIRSMRLDLARLHLTVSIGDVLLLTFFYPFMVALVLILLLPLQKRQAAKSI